MIIPYGKQSVDDDDIASIVRTLKSDFLTCGPEVDFFESEFASMVGAKHAVAVGNATQALHLALLVGGIKPSDRVVTSPNTFLASANCAAFVGATPDFSDIDPISHNLCPHALETGWSADTKAVVAVDYAGQPANMPEISRIAKNHGAIVIEDACHATGGSFYHGERAWKIGAHPWADITTFSFHPVKTMTSAEGGMLVTNNDDYAKLARLLRGHGMERDPERFQGFGTNAPDYVERGPWVYEMQQLGYNYRITDLQCALGRSQLKKLDRFIDRRLEIVARYNESFADLPWLTTPKLADWLLPCSESPNIQDPKILKHRISWHLYTVLIDFPSIGKTRSQVMMELKNKGIGSQVLYIPVHLQPWYRKTYGYQSGKCPVAEEYYTRALSLPLYPAMTEENVESVITEVRRLAIQ